jgi:hypothetical protein
VLIQRANSIGESQKKTILKNKQTIKEGFQKLLNQSEGLYNYTKIFYLTVLDYFSVVRNLANQYLGQVDEEDEDFCYMAESK